MTTTELHTDDEAGRRRPDVSGDLPTVLEAAPAFRRVVAGYDRFQVDTYVRWAEDELATADREREHLLTRHLRTRADLEDAQRLLAHSCGGAESLRLSSRIGSVLAVAADEAEGLRAEAEADRTAAAAEAARTVARAEQVLAGAEDRAGQLLADAAARLAESTAGAERVVADARAAADALLEEARLVEQRAAEHAGRIRQRARDDADVARLQARDEVLRVMETGRDERRRADDEAAAARERLDRDAGTRRAALLADVAALEGRRAALAAEVDRLAAAVPVPADGRRPISLPRLLDRLGRRQWSWRVP
ncbi:hypothetical protein SAMN05660657_03724 [Geodermatophilus amargosae]|uniref:DivIVA protein n=1 Tax=Geodermatophilus amargosae TaxID=1296565 RepID=A0A1I7BP42_9ACTN|nr:hypothetical protein [Geodermatophilus amargosae]SFT88929.1 hypothetical protein SAMN05660657_03724 [Geodermatophilus amargosae]